MKPLTTHHYHRGDNRQSNLGDNLGEKNRVHLGEKSRLEQNYCLHTVLLGFKIWKLREIVLQVGWIDVRLPLYAKPFVLE